MTVYADILILLNFLIDYFLLRITDIILKCRTGVLRMIFSSLAGGILSLYIFLPQMNTFAEIFLKILICFFIDFLCFGFKSAARFFRCAAVFSLVTFGFGGICIAVWYALKPQNMIIKNSIVYFDISPTVLIISALGFYLVSSLVKLCFGKKLSAAERCTVKLNVEGRTLFAEGILDTGNNLTDIFGGKAILIISKGMSEKLLSFCKNSAVRYRAVPLNTVTGSGILDGYRLDSAEIVYSGKTKILEGAVAAISKTPTEDNEIIINPTVLE